MSEKKEHWATRLKRQLREEKQKVREVRELVRNPDSPRSMQIRMVVNFEADMEDRMMFGSYSKGSGGLTDGLYSQMVAAEHKKS
jgi:hypothetical protein